MKKSLNDFAFVQMCEDAGLDRPVCELAAIPNRRFRFDWAWPRQKVALEVEGAVWTGGRHTHPTGFTRDMEKYNLAAMNGWIVVRCEPKNLCTAATITMIKTVIEANLRGHCVPS